MEAGPFIARSPAPGRRERKKRRTHQAIADAALTLFAQRGFQATTIQHIADFADVAPRTIWAHFPTKEDLAFPDHAEVRDSLARRLAERPPGATAIEALRAWITDYLGDESTYELRLRRLKLIKSEPALRDHARVLMAEIEELLAGAVAEDLGESKDALAPRMVAAATIAALDALQPPDPADKNSHRAAIELVDSAMAFVAGGIEALRRGR